MKTDWIASYVYIDNIPRFFKRHNRRYESISQDIRYATKCFRQALFTLSENVSEQRNRDEKVDELHPNHQYEQILRK